MQVVKESGPIPIGIEVVKKIGGVMLLLKKGVIGDMLILVLPPLGPEAAKEMEPIFPLIKVGTKKKIGPKGRTVGIQGLVVNPCVKREWILYCGLILLQILMTTIEMTLELGMTIPIIDRHHPQAEIKLGDHPPVCLQKMEEIAIPLWMKFITGALYPLLLKILWAVAAVE